MRMNQRATDATPRRTPHAIEGVWEAVRLEFAGETAPDMMLEKTEVVFRDGAYLVLFGGEVSFKGSYALTAIAPGAPGAPGATDKSGAHATLHIEGRRAGERNALVIRGICQLAGNRLRVCLGMDGMSPDAFATKPGSQHYLGTYRRKIQDAHEDQSGKNNPTNH